MNFAWGDFWRKSQYWLRIGWLMTAVVVAIYIGVIGPLQRSTEYNSQRATGLRESTDSVFLWKSRSIAGGGGGVYSRLSTRTKAEPVQLMGMVANATPAPAKAPEEDRKLVRTCTMDIIVKAPVETADKIRAMAEDMGGYLENSQINGSQQTGNASLTIRVPASRLEEARSEIRKLGLRLESDHLEAQDVTKDYVDREARLRNLHAQEEQYLAIMKHATTVKDTLEVSEQLTDVRGQIEQEQAEFKTLSKQIETVAISVTLSAQADAQVFGLSWRPIYRLKIAARDGLDGLGDYLATMTSLVFYLPTILLWLATLLIGAAVCWRILRWGARILFVPRKTTTAEAR